MKNNKKNYQDIYLERWKQKSSKCYWIKKQIELFGFHTHPRCSLMLGWTVSNDVAMNDNDVYVYKKGKVFTKVFHKDKNGIKIYSTEAKIRPVSDSILSWLENSSL